MNTKELVCANDLADELIAKLEKIKSLWGEIPSVDDLTEIGKEAAAIAASLNEASETYGADNFPGIDGLAEIGKEAANIAVVLSQARETYAASDFPGADDFDDLDTKLGSIAGSLNDIVEKQVEVAE